LFFISFFGVACVLALAEPFWGIAAYVTHYHSYPERSWWGAFLASLGVRYSFTISLSVAVGTLLNFRRLPYGRLISRQETLYLAFLAWVFVARQLNGQETYEDVLDKMLKMAVFLLCLTHVLVTRRQFDRFFWVLVCCALYLGYECFTAPASRFTKGRLEGVGGPDFGDANAMAAHLVALLAIIGVQFLRSGWKGKFVCFVAGGLILKGILQTRSRGGFLAAIVGAFVVVAFAPSGHRKRILPFLVIAALGALTRVDSAYLERMGSIKAGEREKDESAMSRLRFWQAGLEMALDNPLGVGPGNFHTHIGNYLPEDAGRDTHNTFVRCVAELGWPGLVLLLGLIANAFIILARVRSSATDFPGSNDCAWYAYSLQIGLSAYLVAALFISATYIEMLWWMLLLPAALERAAANALAGRTA
jgi:O-antigen ligase